MCGGKSRWIFACVRVFISALPFMCVIKTDIHTYRQTLIPSTPHTYTLKIHTTMSLHLSPLLSSFLLPPPYISFLSSFSLFSFLLRYCVPFQSMNNFLFTFFFFHLLSIFTSLSLLPSFHLILSIRSFASICFFFFFFFLTIPLPPPVF